MKQYTITIPDNKETIFVEMMKSISFVKNIEKGYLSDIPEEHKAMVRERIKKYETKPESYVEWDDIENRIILDK